MLLLCKKKYNRDSIRMNPAEIIIKKEIFRNKFSYTVKINLGLFTIVTQCK